MTIPTIETERLRLRAFQGGDLEPYAEMYADDRFVRYLGGKTLTTEQAWENMAIDYNQKLLERLRKESLHELGHTFGLFHCPSRDCVMHLSNTVVDVDIRGRDFCRGCRTVVASKTGTEGRG